MDVMMDFTVEMESRHQRCSHYFNDYNFYPLNSERCCSSHRNRITGDYHELNSYSRLNGLFSCSRGREECFNNYDHRFSNTYFDCNSEISSSKIADEPLLSNKVKLSSKTSFPSTPDVSSCKVQAPFVNSSSRNSNNIQLSAAARREAFKRSSQKTRSFFGSLDIRLDCNQIKTIKRCFVIIILFMVTSLVGIQILISAFIAAFIIYMMHISKGNESESVSLFLI